MVFISHSSKDKAIADAICNHLESAAIKCWIAPRDIEAGSDWTTGIIRGIAECRILVLVFSAHANDSEHVGREVARAFSMGLAVIPIRVETVAPRESLAYFLATVHWLDATTPPLHKHLRSLTERVMRLLSEADRGTAVSTEVTPETTTHSARSLLSRRSVRIIGAALAAAVVAISAAVSFFAFQDRAAHQTALDGSLATGSAKSIAVLPFENIGANKDDAYFADGVQDEILNHLAKIAQLKVISRTSVMQYRADTKRNLRQIADALGVASVLEGAVRRNGNRIRVSTELIDARNDNTVWAESYDRDLTDIFAIQSEVAQTIADKLTATLSPEEKKSIAAKPTSNLAAYDLYLRARQLFLSARISFTDVTVETPLNDGIRLLEQAVRLDPKFTLAYCAAAETHDLLFELNPNPERRALADTAVQRALELQPDFSEAHLAFARHLYFCYRDYAQARMQLTIAKRGLPNNVDASLLEAYMDRRQGNCEKAIREFNEVIARDPRNAIAMKRASRYAHWDASISRSRTDIRSVDQSLPGPTNPEGTKGGGTNLFADGQ
jgi:TolB-like protein